MRIDVDKYFKVLQEQVRSDQSIVKSMGTIMDFCESDIPHKDWKTVRELEVESEVKRAGKWIPRVLEKDPAPFPIEGIYFGLGEFESKEGIEYADLYFGVMGQCDLEDKEFRWVYGDKRHYPERAYLRSKLLKQIGVTCYGEESGLDVDGQYTFSIAYAALLLTQIMSPNLYGQLNVVTDQVGLLTGFDSGDILRLGTLTRDGFIANPSDMI